MCALCSLPFLADAEVLFCSAHICSAVGPVKHCHVFGFRLGAGFSGLRIDVGFLLLAHYNPQGSSVAGVVCGVWRVGDRT